MVYPTEPGIFLAKMMALPNRNWELPSTSDGLPNRMWDFPSKNDGVTQQKLRVAKYKWWFTQQNVGFS